MSKKYLILLLFLLIIGGGIFLQFSSDKNPGVDIESQCEASEMIFYYRPQCGWCQKVKNEGIISKIEQLGVKVKQVNSEIGPVLHQFSGVPTFVINEKVYSGYRTFEQLKELLGC